MTRRLALAFTALALVGCASFEPVPTGNSSPTASVRDTGFSEDDTKAQIFALVEIDGNRTMNSFAASANATYGRDASLTTVFTERAVQAKPMKVTLRGKGKVATQWQLYCLVHNIEKIATKAMRTG